MTDLIHEMERIAEAHPDKRSDLFHGPISEDLLPPIEHELGVSLPRSFRAYLLGFAGGLMLGYEICGIPTEKARIPSLQLDPPITGTSESAILSIIDANRRRREHQPAGYIYFCGDGGDFAFYFDTNRMTLDGECPVVMYGPGAAGVVVANDYIDFLKRLAEGQSFGT
ncbi:MAG TPA: SMI1/KNR4 family protein [Tepidisphaeraceae bacterium]|nr:SMI1/KNR4 family protein [Tepidisphaeraceae bacterium]